MFKYYMEIVRNHDNGFLDWLFHQNVFPLRESTSICLAIAKDSHLRNYLEVHSLGPDQVFQPKSISNPITGDKVLNSDWPIKTHNPRSKILESRQINIVKTNFRAFRQSSGSNKRRIIIRIISEMLSKNR